MRPWRPLLLVVALAALVVGAWLAMRGTDAPSRTDAEPRATLERPDEPAAPILLGRREAVDPTERWWLTVTVLEASDDTPVARTELTFVLWLADLPKLTVPVKRTTDEHGRVRIGPILAPFAKAALDVAIFPGVYELAKQVARAEADPSKERELRATCRVLRVSKLTGRVALPPGVPAGDVVVWLGRGHRFWEPLEVDEDGRFVEQVYGRGLVVLEAVALGEGKRWYARAKVEREGSDVVLALSEARPGDPTLLRVHLVRPGGAPTTGRVSWTIDTPMVGSTTRGPTFIHGTGKIPVPFEPAATIELEVRGSTPAGPEVVKVGGITFDQVEVTVEFPGAAEARGDGGPSLSEVQRPSVSHSLPAANSLVVRVRDWDFNHRGVWACLVRGRRIFSHRRLDAEGVAQLPAPDDLAGHRVWIAGIGGDRYVREDLEAGRRDVEVRPQLGGTVKGTARFPGGVEPEAWFVMAPGPAMAATSFDVGAFDVSHEGTTFEVHGVPPGTWDFSLWHKVDGDYQWIDFEARVGEHVVVDVKAE